MTLQAVAAGLADRVDAALPQTQCTRCGFPDCRSYAQAIALDGAPIDRCPPGGDAGVARLAALTGRPISPLNPENGSEGPRLLAVIDEAWCIGCTLCLDACPVDAIMGASKQMHSVVDAQCTGCELCVPACPVDCIALVEASGGATGWNAWSEAQAQEARERYEFHRLRSVRDDAEQQQRLAERARQAMDVSPAQSKASAALERARARRSQG
jgi:electron transport complex protein RnfB